MLYFYLLNDDLDSCILHNHLIAFIFVGNLYLILIFSYNTEYGWLCSDIVFGIPINRRILGECNARFSKKAEVEPVAQLKMIAWKIRILTTVCYIKLISFLTSIFLHFEISRLNIKNYTRSDDKVYKLVEN